MRRAWKQSLSTGVAPRRGADLSAMGSHATRGRHRSAGCAPCRSAPRTPWWRGSRWPFPPARAAPLRSPARQPTTGAWRGRPAPHPVDGRASAARWCPPRPPAAPGRWTRRRAPSRHRSRAAPRARPRWWASRRSRSGRRRRGDSARGGCSRGRSSRPGQPPDVTAAMARGEGYRSMKASNRSAMRDAWVCWSMTSATRTGHGSRRRRNGSSRCSDRYQVSIRRRIASSVARRGAGGTGRG